MPTEKFKNRLKESLKEMHRRKLHREFLERQRRKRKKKVIPAPVTRT